MKALATAISRRPKKFYLLRDLVIGHVNTGGDGPLDVQVVLIQLQ